MSGDCSHGNIPDKCPTCFVDREYERDIEALKAQRDELLESLKATLQAWVDLANSGDAGFWDPEKEPHVIAARAAIAKAEGER